MSVDNNTNSSGGFSDSELEMLRIKVDVWKTIVDVQKHFNDLEMKVRNFGILILSAFLGAMGVGLSSTSNYAASAVLSLGAIAVWYLFYFVDVYWYHPLLLGAVKKGVEIENELEPYINNIGLTKKIGEESPCDVLWKEKAHSTFKAKVFYHGIAIVLLCIFIGLMSFQALKSGGKENVKLEVQCIFNKDASGLGCAVKSH